MSSIAEQVKEIEEQLRKEAERLGQLNLKSNDFIEMNEQLAVHIIDLKNKIAKKKHMIEQQNKDKMLIHQKLIKSEREKQLLQIENQIKMQQKQKRLEKQQIELSNRPITNHIQTLTRNGQENKVEEKNEQQQKNVEVQQEQNLQPVQSKQQALKQPEQEQTQSHTQQYAQISRGEYQPPMLFEENQEKSQEKQQKSQEQDSDQEDEDVLARLRATVKDDDKEDQDDEDQDKL